MSASEKDTYILSIDQGTSGTMATIHDSRGAAVAQNDIPVRSVHSGDGRIEQYPQELLVSIRNAVSGALKGAPVDAAGIAGFALANQGESFLLWDMDTGEPLTRVISWQDVRSAELCTNLRKRAGTEQRFRSRTGLPVDPEWPATKVLWLRENDAAVASAISRKRRIAYGQLDAWFLFSLSGGRYHCTDHATASRSGFYNIHTLQWDEELIEEFGGKGLVFPEVVSNTVRFDGITDLVRGVQIPWVASCLDQAAALLGQRCLAPGDTKVTYGTCTGLWCNAGHEPGKLGALTTSVAWHLGGEATYALVAEGSAAGTVISWLKHHIGTNWTDQQLAAVVGTSDGNPDLLFLPAFHGLGAPHWNADVRGAIFGLQAGTTPGEILRAGLKGIAYGVREMLDALEAEYDVSVTSLIADGGLANSRFLMQTQADVLIRPVLVPDSREGTALGMAWFAALSLGMYRDLQDIPAVAAGGDLFQPGQDVSMAVQEYARWRIAVEQTVRYHKRIRELQ